MPPATSGAAYYLLVLDDICRLVRIHLLYRKPETKSHLWSSDKQLVEAQPGVKVAFSGWTIRESPKTRI